MTEQQARTLWRYMTNSNETRALLESMGCGPEMFESRFDHFAALDIAALLRSLADQMGSIDDSAELDPDDR